MIESLTDLYRYVRALRDDLRLGPDAELASMLDVALSGTTSGEVLGNLWFALGKVRDRGAQLGPIVGSELEDSIAFIQQVLGPPR